ncbi:Probable ribose-5-phosphate isomerase 1 [Linum perenne]
MVSSSSSFLKKEKKFLQELSQDDLKKISAYRAANLNAAAGCDAELRMMESGGGRKVPYVTDNGNYIVDYLKREIGDLKAVSDSMIKIWMVLLSMGCSWALLYFCHC